MPRSERKTIVFLISYYKQRQYWTNVFELRRHYVINLEMIMTIVYHCVTTQ